jgi:hypothetical protein
VPSINDKGPPLGDSPEVSGEGAPSGQENEPPANTTAGIIAERIRIYSSSASSEPLRQGEILSGILHRRRSLRSLLPSVSPEIIETEHPYAILVSQDCDLENDFKYRSESNAEQLDDRSDKILPNSLFCEVVTVEELCASVPRGKDIWKRIIQNKDERYQVLEAIPPSEDALKKGIPSLGIDFKRYFSIPTDELYVQLKTGGTRRCRLNSPFLEALCGRFVHYLSRVALPKEHSI